MKAGILTDSHDHCSRVSKAAQILREQKVAYVLHAGDIVSPQTAKVLADIDGAKFIGVFGNCDREKALLKSCINELGGEIYERVFTGQVAGRRTFLTHKPDELESIVDTGNFDLVIYGHTHKKLMHKIGETLVINPGPSSVVILELDDMSTVEMQLE